MRCNMQWSSSYDDARERRQQGLNALIERTAEAHLYKNLRTHFGRDQGVEIIQWLQGIKARPVLDFETAKAWLLSDGATLDIGQDVDFSAYADVQEQCCHSARTR